MNHNSPTRYPQSWDCAVVKLRQIFLRLHGLQPPQSSLWDVKSNGCVTGLLSFSRNFQTDSNMALRADLPTSESRAHIPADFSTWASAVTCSCSSRSSHVTQSRYSA